MDWLQIIIEWINCLNVLETPIKDIDELKDRQLWGKLMKSLIMRKDINESKDEDIFTEFIKDEYPKFQINKDEVEKYPEDVYTISLLLSYASQNSIFHLPMCTKLQHETQIKIKSFLEMILPYGKSISFEILKDAIMELTGIENKNVFKTPNTHSLKQFFGSPVVRSAQNSRILNERNRELRLLKSELEVERFEKTDLMEDLRIEKNHVKRLTKILEEKTLEIKKLKEEKNKLTSPRSCKKGKNTFKNEDYYKREIQKLENQLIQSQDNVTKLEENKTTVMEKLTFLEKKNVSLNEKCNGLERSIEMLTIEMESKEREIIDLKITNEDLRRHLKELTGTSIEDSFEVDGMIFENSSLVPMNTSETLSTVIDVQLQEARNENTLLKTQLNQLQEKFNISLKENQDSMELMSTLQNEVKMLNDIKLELNNAKEEIIRLKANNLITNKNLEDLLVSKNEILSQREECEKVLNEKINYLKKELHDEIVKSSDLSDALVKAESILKEHDNTLELIKFQDKELSTLNLHIEHLHMERHHLIHMQEESDNKAKESIIELQTQLLDKQNLLEKLNMDIKLKDDTISILRSQIDTLSKETIASEMILKKIITTIQKANSVHDNALMGHVKALKDKFLQLNHLQTKFDLMKEKLRSQFEKEKSLRNNLECKLANKDITISDLENNISELQESLKIKTNELNVFKECHDTVNKNNKEIVETCKELKDYIKKLKCTFSQLLDSTHKKHDSTAENISNESQANDENEFNVISKIITFAINDMKSIKEDILHLSTKNTNLEKIIDDQKKIIVDNIEIQNENTILRQKINDLKISEQNRKSYIENIIKEKEKIQEILSKVILSLENSNDSFISLKQKWDQALNEFNNLSTIVNNLKCKDMEQLQTKKKILQETLNEYDVSHLKNIKSITDIIWKKFSNMEQKLMNIYSQCLNDNKENSDVECNIEENDVKEEEIIKGELENIDNLCNDIIKSDKEIETFKHSINSYKKNSTTKQAKENVNDKKLQVQIDQLTREKKEMKNKLDMMRVRNAKLERTLEEVRTENKKNKEVTHLKSQSTDLNDLKKQVTQLKQEALLLQERNKLRKELQEETKNKISETQLKEIHNKYEIKLEEMKQQMKIAYNEQMVKLNKEQEKTIELKVEQLQLKLEQQCQLHKEEINKYKTHVNELNSQFWNVGEKLLTVQQEKQEALQQLHEFKIKMRNQMEQKTTTFPMQHRTIKLEKQEIPLDNSIQNNSHTFTKPLTEENTYEKCHSAKNMHAMVNAFKAEDEEGEVFDNIYLADMKEGHGLPTVDFDRLSALQMRNSLCKPHLKSSYPAETQFQPLYFTEEEIKTGSVSDDVFNDSLSQILLPDQKTKKRDRTQPSYKKPGPPTPSKNGGRLSLHGNELKSPNSRILRERNADRRATATPRRTKGLLYNLRRQDENTSNTPRVRRLSNIFRKQRSNMD